MSKRVIVAVACNAFFLYEIARNKCTMAGFLTESSLSNMDVETPVNRTDLPTAPAPANSTLGESPAVFESTTIGIPAVPLDTKVTTDTVDAATTISPAFYQVDPLFQAEYDRIGNEDPAIKCSRYGYGYNSTATTIAPRKRRIFFGALVADDNYDVVRAHATEAYGLYHLVSITECNSTFAATPRKLRFAPGTEGYDLLHSSIFGPSTPVHVNVFLGDAGGARLMDREYIQRDTIVDAWVKGGMTVEDIGLVADMDEVFSRDFLLAAQICDIPAFEPGNNCKTPKVVASAVHYESSPDCTQKYGWHHPDMVIGDCVMGVGDPTGRIVPVRDNRNRVNGARVRGHGKSRDDYTEHHKALDRYPLHTATDFRMADTGVQQVIWLNHPKPGRGDAYFTGFHLHNFFEDLQVLRNKYKTYGHANPKADKAEFTMSNISPEWDMVIRCVKSLPNEANVDGLQRQLLSFVDLNGNKPIFFLNETYRKERHELVKAMIAEEEKVYGEFYKDVNKTR